jgi:hypothetical protein
MRHRTNFVTVLLFLVALAAFAAAAKGIGHGASPAGFFSGG